MVKFLNNLTHRHENLRIMIAKASDANAFNQRKTAEPIPSIPEVQLVNMVNRLSEQRKTFAKDFSCETKLENRPREKGKVFQMSMLQNAKRTRRGRNVIR